MVLEGLIGLFVQIEHVVSLFFDRLVGGILLSEDKGSSLKLLIDPDSTVWNQS